MDAELTFAIDTSIHELEAIKRVSYALSDRYSFQLHRINDSSIRVTSRAKVGELSPDLALRFEELLIDYGIRLTLARETAEIRDLIYRQAFVEADL